MRIVIVAFALAVLAIMGLTAVQASLEDAGTDVTVTNETWTPDAGNITTLNDSQINGAYYDDTVTVYDENDTEMTAGTDYEWFPTNGTVKALAGGGLDGDASATITYRYQETTLEQRNIAELLTHVPRTMGMALPVFLVLFFLLALRGGGL